MHKLAIAGMRTSRTAAYEYPLLSPPCFYLFTTHDLSTGQHRPAIVRATQCLHLPTVYYHRSSATTIRPPSHPLLYQPPPAPTSHVYHVQPLSQVPVAMVEPQPKRLRYVFPQSTVFTWANSNSPNLHLRSKCILIELARSLVACNEPDLRGPSRTQTSARQQSASKSSGITRSSIFPPLFVAAMLSPRRTGSISRTDGSVIEPDLDIAGVVPQTTALSGKSSLY